MSQSNGSGLKAIIYTFILGVITGYVLANIVLAAQAPNCPEEDSCAVDYRDGRWYIEEVKP